MRAWINNFDELPEELKDALRTVEWPPVELQSAELSSSSTEETSVGLSVGGGGFQAMGAWPEPDTYCAPLSTSDQDEYSDWLSGFNIQETGYADNPAGDGVPNLIKYALGLDPRVDARKCLPRVIVKEHDGEYYLALTFLRPKWEPETRLRFVLASSPDLFNWTNHGTTTVLTEDLPAEFPQHYEQVWMLDNVPVSQDPRRFLRLRVIPYPDGDDPDLGWTLAGCLLSDDPGMVLEDVRYVGHFAASNCFEGGEAHGLGIDEGVVLTTGWASDWTKRAEELMVNNNAPGDAQLDGWMDDSGWYNSNNAAVLEIDFTPEHDRITLEYLFASDEYYEAYGPKDDAFAVFLGRYLDYENGVVDWSPARQEDDGNIDGNIALLPIIENPDTTSREIAVYNIGEVWGSGTEPNQANYMDWFVNNSADPTKHTPSKPNAPPYDVAYSGFTQPFEAVAEVVPLIEGEPQKYILRIVVADESDGQFDAAAFLKGGSLRSFSNEE